MFTTGKHRAPKSALRRAGRAGLAVLLCAAALSVPTTAPASAEGGGTAAGSTAPAIPADTVLDVYVVVGPEGNPATARCRDGDYVVNGGWEASHGEHALFVSSPASDARGWEVSVNAGTAWAYAVCADLADGVVVYTAEAPTGRTTETYRCDVGDWPFTEWTTCGGEAVAANGTAHCAAGDRVIGGGWRTGQHDQLIASHPTGSTVSSGSAAVGPATGWTVNSVLGYARALCTSADGPFGDVQVARTPMPGSDLGKHSMVRADCPAGTAVIGGGFYARHDTLLRSHPLPPATWFTEQSAGMLGDSATYALCMPLGRGFSAATVTPVAHVPHGGGFARAVCPDGFRIFGGGVSLDPHPSELNAGLWRNRPEPDGASWAMEAHHTGEVHGICLRLARSTATVLRVETTPAYEGEPVTLVADVRAAAGRPGGRVTFRDGNTELGTTTVSPDGDAWLHPSSLAAGTHTVTATYEGDSTYAASTSAPVTFEIRPPRSATAVQLTASSDPAPRGTPVTLTARVVPTPAGSNPTGAVEFLDAGVQIGTAALSGGVATLSHTFDERDVHVLQAVYRGDDAHQGSAGRLSLLVATLLTVDDVTITESEAAPATGLIQLRISEALDVDLPVHLAADADAAELFPGGAAPSWTAVIPAGSQETTVPVTVAAQLEQHDRVFDIHVDAGGDGIYLTRNPVRGTVEVTHPTCTIAGTDAADRLRGTDGDDVICSLDGDDDVDGGAGADVILGGDGNDDLLGGTGDDRIVGGRGGDRLMAGAGSDTLLALDGVEGNDRLVGGRGGSCESDPGDARTRC